MLVGSLQSLVIFQLLSLLLLDSCYSVEGTVTQSPPFACAENSITVSCVQTVPNAGAGDVFDVIRPNFIIGPTNITVTEATVDGTSTANNIDFSRFTATTNAGSNTEVSGSITLLSYINNTDEGLRMGCGSDYRAGGVGDPIQLIQTLTLVQAGLPSISTPIATFQNLNPSTCEGTLRFNLAATSDRDITSYSILFNGSSIASNLPSSDTEFTHNTQFLLNTNYPTSIIATSCAGNSNDGDASVRVNGYMQSDVSCAQYNNMTGTLTIDWTLNTPSQPTGISGISIAYSVRVTYSHSNRTVTYLFTDTSNFNLISTVTAYDVPLTPHNFTNPQRVETNITAYVRILQQCGQDLVGTELSCSLRSVTSPPEIPTPTISSSPIPPSSSSITIPISPTPSVTMNNPTTSSTNPPALGLNPAIIGGAIGGIIVALIILLIVLILLAVCIYCLKKRDQEPKESDRFNMGGFDVNQSKESVDRQPEATYSQVNKPSKSEQPLYADIKKPQKELLYADLEHVTPTSGMVKPPTVPTTHYADLAQFSHSEQTQYSTVQDTMH